MRYDMRLWLIACEHCIFGHGDYIARSYLGPGYQDTGHLSNQHRAPKRDRVMKTASCPVELNAVYRLDIFGFFYQIRDVL